MLCARGWMLVGAVAVALGACTTTKDREPVGPQSQAAEAAERVDTAAWMTCARNLVSRAKTRARTRLRQEESPTREVQDMVLDRGLAAALLAVENGCGMAPFYGIRMRQAVRELWREV